MEADEATEEIDTTMDAEQHPSSKDPSMEDLQEFPLEPSISEATVEPQASQDITMASPSQIPLELHLSETPLVPSTSQSPLEPTTSHISLQQGISETSSIPPTSQSPLKPYASGSPSEPTTSHVSLQQDVSETPPILPTSQSPLEPTTSHISLQQDVSETPPIPPISQSSLELHASGSPSEPTTSHISLQQDVSETPPIPPTSQSPLVLHASGSPLEPTISLQQDVSETPLKPPTSEILLGTQSSEVPEKHLSFQPSSLSLASGSSSGVLEEDLSEPSSSESSHTRRATQVPEVEYLPEHSLRGPSAHFSVDISAKLREEEDAEEEEEEVDTSDITVHPGQPEHQLSKKKARRDIVCHSVDPATEAELVEAANTMQREQFGTQVNYIFQWEKNTALNAIQSGLYIGWRCPHYLWDCFRIRDESKCFCGHLLREHHIMSDISVPCRVSQCRCLMFCFIPSRPEEVGEFWLKRRATFDPKAWRAHCRCKHSHEDHAAMGPHPCRHHGCCCSCFESNFLCAACDRRWEEHETFFETEETRRRRGRPHGSHAVSSWHRPI
ncbi:protein FAM221B isoform X2 [Ochotona princeps]|uniref:protein FAM221B isoform X2 n=1 Tax=Ochotona princeps TaxID=9978 RepID=UPI002714ED0E|nr:protein FAM221B isoform X2 [Ochotona princeps]